MFDVLTAAKRTASASFSLSIERGISAGNHARVMPVAISRGQDSCGRGSDSANSCGRCANDAVRLDGNYLHRYYRYHPGLRTTTRSWANGSNSILNLLGWTAMILMFLAGGSSVWAVPLRNSAVPQSVYALFLAL